MEQSDIEKVVEPFIEPSLLYGLEILSENLADLNCEHPIHVHFSPVPFRLLLDELDGLGKTQMVTGEAVESAPSLGRITLHLEHGIVTVYRSWNL